VRETHLVGDVAFGSLVNDPSLGSSCRHLEGYEVEANLGEGEMKEEREQEQAVARVRSLVQRDFCGPYFSLVTSGVDGTFQEQPRWRRIEEGVKEDRGRGEGARLHCSGPCEVRLERKGSSESNVLGDKK
jgi:hypothetical protein